MKTFERYLWADVIRILAIFLVVATHVSFLPKEFSPGNLYLYIYVAVTRTCIPLFVMLSGALLLTKEEPVKIFIKKRVGRIILPWLFWTVLYFFIQHDVHSLSSFPAFIKAFISTFESFWFLPMVVGLYFITPPLRIFLKAVPLQYVTYIVVLWFFAVSLLPYIHNSQAFPLNVDNGLLRQVINFAGYYLLGFILVQIKNILSIRISLMTILFGIVLSGIVLLQHYNSSTILEWISYISPSIVLLSLGIMSSFMHLPQDLRFSKLSKSIANLSRASFGIYLAHILVFVFILKFVTVQLNTFLDELIWAILLFTVSFFVIFIMQKIPIIKKFAG